MKVIRFVLLVCAVLFALPTNSQVLRTGLLVGGGLGFEHNLTPNSGRPDIWQEGDYKIDYKDKYQFGASLGYRFILYLECHNNQNQPEISKRKYLIVKLF